MPDLTETQELAVSPNEEVSETFAISTVARLTGLSVHTIRAWEKRYSVVDPLRTDTQRRVYTRDQVRKLSLLRAVVDNGEPISSVANLNVAQLEQRLELGIDPADPGFFTASPEPRTAPPPAWRVAIAGSSLLAIFETQSGFLPGMEICRSWESLESALEDGALDDSLDLLVVQADTLFAGRLDRIRDLAIRTFATRTIIVYGFAPHEVIARVNRTPRFTALRWPVNAEEIRLATGRPLEPMVAAAKPTADGKARTADLSPVARHFTPQQLARLAKMAPATHCECPQHLGNLIISLSAFETYTSECDNPDADDLALHARLQRAASIARSELESALQFSLERRGIQL